MTFAIAAAGTGGHLYPALAVGHQLVADGIRPERILFIGGDRLEARLVPEAGFPFLQVELRGLRRGLSPGILANLGLPSLMMRASRRIGLELGRRGTAVLLGMGGYATVPAAWAARRNGVTLFVHEQNAVPGLANRVVARWAGRTFVAFPRTARFPRAEVVGNPLRPELARFSRPQLRHLALARYGLEPGGLTLGVMGGSLGAQALNRAVIHLVEGWGAGPLQIVHLTGRAQAQEVEREAQKAQLPWRVVPFEDRMEFFYAASDLVVSRAGALTVSELAATATPAVLVPPARLSRLNQEANAALLVEAGAAALLPEASLGNLGQAVAALAVDSERRRQMAIAAAGVSHRDAAARISRAMREEAADG